MSDEKPPCQGCGPDLANILAAVTALNHRMDDVVNAVNATGQLSQSHLDTLQGIMNQFTEFRQHIANVGPAAMLKSLMGAGTRGRK